MIFTAVFTYNGAPKLLLSPLITIYDVSDGSAVVSGADMTEIGGGFYKYNYTSFDSTKNYVFVCDGGAAQQDGERYTYGSSGSTGNIEFLKDMEGGRWKIDETAKTMTFYKEDNTTVIATFNLKDINGNASFESIFERTRA